MNYTLYLEALSDEQKTVEFRKIGSRGPFSDERQHLAIKLARDACDRRDLATAETWALRALNDGPSVDAFCLLGDVCQDTSDLENAVAWYEQACACEVVRRFDDPAVRASRELRLTALRREIREEWESRVPLRELNFQAKRDYYSYTDEFGGWDFFPGGVPDVPTLFRVPTCNWDFVLTVVLDDDLEFISFRPDLKLPHEPNSPHAMWVLPVKEVPEFGDALLLSPRAAKAAAQATSRSTFLKLLPDGAKFGAFTGKL